KRYQAQREPYQDYLKGKYLQSNLTRAELGKSIAHFEAAPAGDRRYALAHCGLAETWILFSLLGLMRAREAQERASEAVRRALEIDSELADAYAARGRIRQFFEYDFEASEADYRRALGLNPDYAECYLWYAGLLAAAARASEALNNVRSAQELDTLSPVLHAETAWIYYL